MKARSIGPALFLMAFAACGGTAGDPGRTLEPAGGPGPSTSSPGAAAGSQGAVILTAAEYASAVSDLLGIPPSAQTVPIVPDGLAAGGAWADTAARAYHNSAASLATTVTSTAGLPALLERTKAGCVPPADGSGATGSACAAAFIDQFAPLAFRQAPDPATMRSLYKVYDTVSATQQFSGGIAAVLQEILQSPYFLYHVQ
jgi:hypothetical protein